MPKRWNIKIIDSSLERIIVSIPCFSDRIDQDVHRLRKKKKDRRIQTTEFTNFRLQQIHGASQTTS